MLRKNRRIWKFRLFTLKIDSSVEENPERTRTSICKQTCVDSDDCNTFRYPDWQEPGPDECPVCVTTTVSETTTPIGNPETTGNPITTTEGAISETTAPEEPETTTASAILAFISVFNLFVLLS